MDQIWMKLFESASVVRNAYRIFTAVCIDTCEALGEITPEWWIK